MSNIKEFLQEEADLIAERKEHLDAAAGRDLTDEEKETDDGLASRIGAVQDRITRERSVLDAEKTLAAVPSWDGVAPAPAAADAEAPKFEHFGEQLSAIYQASIGGARDPRLQIRAVAQGMGEAVGSDGGFLVQQDFATEIFRRVYATGEVASRVRRIPVSGNGLIIPTIDETSRATGSRLGGVQAYWVDEGTAPTATKPKLAKIDLKLNKLIALGYATDELLADAPAMGAVMTEGFADEIQFMTEDAFINGTGAGKPQGILNAAAKVSVSKETNQPAATIVIENIVKMWAQMWGRSRANSVWFINQDIEPQLFTMSLAVGTGGIPVYMPANGLSDSPFGRLFGRPVVPIEYGATLGTEGDIILADLSQYVTIDKGGINQASSMHVRFTTDEMAFRATFRVDGQPMWKSALTPFKGSNDQSPFVTLAVRA